MKVDKLFEEYEFLKTEEKMEFLKRAWKSFREEMMNDAYMEEVMIKMCNEFMDKNSMMTVMKEMFNKMKGNKYNE